MTIFFTDEEMQSFYDNGLNNDDIQKNIDEYRQQGLNDTEIHQNISNRYNKPLTPENGMLKGGVSFDWNNAQDLIKNDPKAAIETMNKEAYNNNIANNPLFAPWRGTVKAGKQIIKAGGQLTNKYLRPLLTKQKPLNNEEFNEAYSFLGATKPKGFLENVGFWTPTFFLPETKAFQGAGILSKIGNSAITGAYQSGLIGGVDSLNEKGDLSGLGKSAAIGGALGGGLQVAGKIGQASINSLGNAAKWGASELTSLKPSTIEQAIKPNSKALDLNEKTTQNLLMNTTERVRNAYNDLLSRRGAAVNDAAKNLNKLDARVQADDLIKDINSTFDQYGGDLVNPARNMTGNLEQDLIDLVNSGKPVVDVDTAILPKFEGDKNAYNREIRNLYKQNVRGKTINHPEQGEIYFPKNGAGETIRKNGMEFEQLSLLPEIDEITQKAKFSHPENLTPGKPNRMKATNFDVLQGRANLNGVPVDTEIKIANTPQGKMFYLNEKPLLQSRIYPPKGEPSVTGTNNIITDNETYFNSISPTDLNKIKEQIGKMATWSDETARQYKNPILEQIYGKYSNRLDELSPELKAANQAYSNLRNFQKNEGLKRILRAGDNIDSASSALRNYNSTVTKGNTGRNIQELENVLNNEGYGTFLNDIDDVNAAMDLQERRKTGINFLGSNNILKSLTGGALKGARALNQNRGLQTIYENLGQEVPNWLIPALYGLYGSGRNLLSE